MLKPLLTTTLRRFGYRLVRVPRDNARLHPRFSRQTFSRNLARAREIANARDPSGTVWRNVKKYMQPKRASFYYEVLERMEAAGVSFDGHTILDVGAFLGDMLCAMHEYHPEGHYYGAEPGIEAFHIGLGMCPFATIRQSSIDELNDRDKYDVILLLEVLEHLAEPERALRKLWSHTRSHLVLTVPNGRYDSVAASEYSESRDCYTGHINFWSPESWPRWLRRQIPDCQLQTGELPTGQLYAVLKSNRSDG